MNAARCDDVVANAVLLFTLTNAALINTIRPLRRRVFETWRERRFFHVAIERPIIWQRVHLYAGRTPVEKASLAASQNRTDLTHERTNLTLPLVEPGMELTSPRSNPSIARKRSTAGAPSM